MSTIRTDTERQEYLELLRTVEAALIDFQRDKVRAQLSNKKSE